MCCFAYENRNCLREIPTIRTGPVSPRLPAANAAGKPVSVCGEAASDPRLAIVLPGVGVTSLSMAASCVAEVRASLAKRTRAECEAAARAALAAASPAQARAAVI